MIGHSQRNFRAGRIRNKNAGVEEISGKTKTRPQVITKITLHFLVVECDSKYIITQNRNLSTFVRKKLVIKNVCTLPLV